MDPDRSDAACTRTLEREGATCAVRRFAEAPFFIICQLDPVAIAVADLDEPPALRDLVGRGEDAEHPVALVEHEALALAPQGPAPRADMFDARVPRTEPAGSDHLRGLIDSQRSKELRRAE